MKRKKTNKKNKKLIKKNKKLIKRKKLIKKIKKKNVIIIGLHSVELHHCPFLHIGFQLILTIFLVL